MTGGGQGGVHGGGRGGVHGGGGGGEKVPGIKREDPNIIMHVLVFITA